MGDVVLYIASSLDGYIADKGGGVGWLEPYQDGDTDYGYGALLERVGSVVMGGRTYRQVMGFGDWPYTGLTCYIVTTRRILKTPAPSVQAFRGDVAELVGRIREVSDRDIWLLGGADLVLQFAKQDLIDEYILFLMPILLGEGIPLFQDIDRQALLRLDSAASYPSGVVELRYHRHESSSS